MKQAHILKLSLFITLIAITAIYFRYHNAYIYYIVKPIPILALIIFVIHNLKNNILSCAKNLVFLLALIFSLTGDIALSLPDKGLAVFGAICFFLVHIFYIYAFWHGYRLRSRASLFILPAVILTSVIIFNIININTPVPKALLILFTLFYFTFITALACIVIYSETGSSEFPAASAGIALFFLSDFILFYQALVPAAPALALVLGTYFSGQLFLTVGFTSRQVKDSHRLPM